MTARSFAPTLVCLLLFAGPAFAMSKNCDYGSSWHERSDREHGHHGHRHHGHHGPPGSSTEQDLQDILDDLVVSGPPINASSPSSFDLFNAGSTGITAQIIVASDDLRFGIYDGDDPMNRVDLLKAGKNFITTVSFSDEGTIQVGGHGKTYPGFDGPFGFYVKTSESHNAVYIFTQDALNGGAGSALVFQGNGETVIKLPGLQAGTFRPDQFILAFDVDGDGVFGDLVVAISGIDSAVPEPGAALLIGVSLLLLGRLRRS